MGHGFFLEDGTEVYNVLDRNLAVQAYIAKPLPKQVLPFDKNDGAGFWWANCLNTFTRNVACECDEYGYFFQATKTADFDPGAAVQQPDGAQEDVDIRTLPFVRFEDNEAHCQRRHAFNLGGGVPFGEPNVDGVGPDAKHPFVIRNTEDLERPLGVPSGVAVGAGRQPGHPRRRLRRLAAGLQAARLSQVNIDRRRRAKPQLRTRSGAAEGGRLSASRSTRWTTCRRRRSSRTSCPPAGQAAWCAARPPTTARSSGCWSTARKRKRWRPTSPSGRSSSKDWPGDVKVTAHAEDAAGNVEKRPHTVMAKVR